MPTRRSIEDDQELFFPFLETSARAAQAIIGDAGFAFEYYLIAPSFAWLVGENHHSYLSAYGPPVEERLRDLAAAD